MSQTFEEKMATLTAQLDELQRQQHAPAATANDKGPGECEPQPLPPPPPQPENPQKPKLLPMFVDMQNEHGNTFLHRANSQQIAQWVTKYSPDLEVRNKVGLTPLLHHAANGNMSAVTELLKHGANPYAADAKGNVIFHYLKSKNVSFEDCIRICDLLKQIDESA